MTMQSPAHQSFNHAAIDPTQWDMVYRSVIVRLGPAWNWYENTAHGSSGIVDVRIDYDTRDLIVETDFVDGVEKILYAGANPDYTLVGKGVMAGASGGSSITKYRIVSSQSFTGYPAYGAIRPHASVFDSNADNLWIHQVSLRPKG